MRCCIESSDFFGQTVGFGSEKNRFVMKKEGMNECSYRQPSMPFWQQPVFWQPESFLPLAS